jgi:hypothetical protein
MKTENTNTITISFPIWCPLPAAPVSANCNFSFTGWFYDEACVNKIQGSDLYMTKNNFPIYVKFEDQNGNAKTYKITLIIPPIKNPSRDTLPLYTEKIQLKTIGDFSELIGWFHDKECTTPFISGTKCKNGTTLFTKWGSPTQIMVRKHTLLQKSKTECFFDKKRTTEYIANRTINQNSKLYFQVIRI